MLKYKLRNEKLKSGFIRTSVNWIENGEKHQTIF